jgi:hypothetical protein
MNVLSLRPFGARLVGTVIAVIALTGAVTVAADQLLERGNAARLRAGDEVRIRDILKVHSQPSLAQPTSFETWGCRKLRTGAPR